MGGSNHPSREESLVIPMEKVICIMEEAGEQTEWQRRRLDQWSPQEQEAFAGVKEHEQYEAWPDVKSAQQEQDIIHDATVLRAQAANQERWSRIKDVYGQWNNNGGSSQQHYIWVYFSKAVQ